MEDLLILFLLWFVMASIGYTVYLLVKFIFNLPKKVRLGVERSLDNAAAKVANQQKDIKVEHHYHFNDVKVLNYKDKD